MRALIAILFVITGSFCAGADNSCLNSIKSKIAASQMEVPAPVLTALGVNPVYQFLGSTVDLGAPVSRKFQSDLADSRGVRGKLSEQGADFTYQLSQLTLQVNYAITPKADEDEKNELKVASEWSVESLNHEPVLLYKQTIGYNKECQAKLLNENIFSFTAKDAKTMIVSLTINEAGLSSRKIENLVSREAIEYAFALSFIRNIKEVHALPAFGGKDQPCFNADENLSSTWSTMKEAKPLRRYNPRSKKIESLQGVIFQLPSVDYTGAMYEYSDGHSLSYGGLGQKIGTWSEESSESDWLASTISQSEIETPVSIVGFAKEDFSKPKLTFNVSGTGKLPELFNATQYLTIDMRTVTNDGWAMTITDAQPESLPSSLPLSAPVSTADKEYLKSSRFIQLNKVNTLLEDIKTKIEGKTRLEVAELITGAVTKAVKYDYEQVYDGRNDYRTAEDVLLSGKGVCHHFAVVFVSVARALGIPARIVFGYALRENSLGAHAWVEVKINNEQWWPLEPQHVGKSLPSRGYMPVTELTFYSSNTKTTDQQWKDQLDYNALRVSTEPNITSFTKVN